MAKALAWEFFACQDTISHSPPMNPKWNPPPPTWVRLNIDASFVNSSTSSGIAGVLRDQQGNWLLGFHKKICTISAMRGELLAILQGLELVVQQDLGKESRASDINHHIIGECRVLMQQGSGLSIEHAPREMNKLADAMAKRCRKGSSGIDVLEVFYSPPLELEKFLLDDKPP